MTEKQPHSILDPRLYGLVYVTGLYGVGKTTLATTAEHPGLTAILDFDLKFRSEAERLGFWYRSPSVDGDWANVNFPSLVNWFRKSLSEIPQETTVVVFDNASPLEGILGHIVSQDPTQYGVNPKNAQTGAYGGVNPGIGKLWKNITQFLQGRGIRLIFTVAHCGSPWVGGSPVPNRFRGKGNRALQELANLSLVLIREKSSVPAGLVIKEQMAQRTFIDGKWAIQRVLPLRFPQAEWPTILGYFGNPADLEDPQPGEIPSDHELAMYGELFTIEQIEFVKAIANSDYTEDGDAPNTECEAAAPTIETLLTQYSAEQIMEANEGRIPGTDEEIAAVAEKLEAE